MHLSRRASIAIIASAFVAPILKLPASAQSQVTKSPPRNMFLSAEKYALTHFDPAQTDVFPYAVPRGTFQVDLRKMPRIPAGPINIMTLATTSPDHMWAASTGGVAYADATGNGWKEVARLDDPAAKALPSRQLDAALAQSFTDLAQVEKVVKDELGLDQGRISANVYIVAGSDDVLYATNRTTITAFGLTDQKNPSAGIKALRHADFAPSLSAKENEGGVLLNMTYDGKLIVAAAQSMRIVNREDLKEVAAIRFGDDERISNAMAVDERNGIYIASDKVMRKVVWTGQKLSMDPADGAWESPYDFGQQQPPSVKFGKGTGSTPTLMGFGDDPDKLVVITDGADKMKLVAFWRDQIPPDWPQVPGAKSNRIAGQVPVTCGLSPQPDFIQSEQSVVVNGYGAFVVNNIRPKGADDRLIDVFAGGPALDPAVGAERFEWDPSKHAWRSVWTRSDVVSTSMVPTMSGPSGIVFVNGYTKQDGWEVTGMDWATGQTVHRTIFGQDNLGNGAYALIQFFPNGDMLFNSIGGPTRVKLQ